MSDQADWWIDHTGIGVADIERSARFYDAALGALGKQRVVEISIDGKLMSDDDVALGGVAYGVNFPVFWLDIFHPHDARQHTAFRARSREQVDAFHAAAITAGGTDNGAPGLRTGGYPPGYYAAFVLDPDGNNIEAVFRSG